MKVSIIIVTYNRPDDLSITLESILVQSYLPIEIIIVDNGNALNTKAILENTQNILKSKNIQIKYLENTQENSLTLARNMGYRHSIGDVILFLDDDVLLDRNYLKELVATYQNYPDAVGVQGQIYRQPDKYLFLKNIFNLAFFLSPFRYSRYDVLPSINIVRPLALRNTAPCQWLSGANMSYKRKVFAKLSFDEQLKKYSEGEDLDFSYRVYLNKLGTLYMTPHARLMHLTSPQGRLPKKELIYMQEVYRLYLFYKLFPPNLKNQLIFAWSKIGRLLFNIMYSFYRPSFSGFLENKYLIQAIIYCLRHQKYIRNGELYLFNQKVEY